ncbi:hypothetical protein K2173_022981 [Erythroxylum novogranatense]|uniref:Secreted protein n=1 Tax=Erythroxylum novogranatense TaxID=1862640 RepID=A0AAV8T7T5_9ROSI|nr:hypothetical protein K2173_022981 [Erythroxylum novogranatense]
MKVFMFFAQGATTTWSVDSFDPFKMTFFCVLVDLEQTLEDGIKKQWKARRWQRMGKLPFLFLGFHRTEGKRNCHVRQEHKETWQRID